MMLSELEYSYFDPGVKLSCLGAKDSSTAGRGALCGDLARAFTNALVMKLGIPLVCCKSSRSVTFDQAPGSPGSRLPTVSPRDSLPSATRDRATAPLNAFATLGSRIESDALIGAPVATLAVPARCSTARPPRCTTTAIPGGPSGCRTS